MVRIKNINLSCKMFFEGSIDCKSWDEADNAIKAFFVDMEPNQLYIVEAGITICVGDEIIEKTLKVTLTSNMYSAFCLNRSFFKDKLMYVLDMLIDIYKISYSKTEKYYVQFKDLFKKALFCKVISKKEWDRIHEDYKATLNNGVKSILGLDSRGATCLMPVIIVD